MNKQQLHLEKPTCVPRKEYGVLVSLANDAVLADAASCLLEFHRRRSSAKASPAFGER